MADIWLPPCTSSTTKCLQWWACTPVNRHRLQDYFGPEMGGGGGYTSNFTVLINIRRIPASLSLCLGHSILSYGEIFQRQPQAQAVSQTKQTRSALPSPGATRIPCNAACLTLGDVLHMLTGYVWTC